MRVRITYRHYTFRERMDALATPLTRRDAPSVARRALALGVYFAAALVLYDVTSHSRAYLAAHSGGSITALLVDGFIGSALGITLALFASAYAIPYVVRAARSASRRLRRGTA